MHAPLSRSGLVWLAVVVCAWGLTWPVSKLILASVPPLWTVAFRSAIGCVAMLAIGLIARRLAWPPRADMPVLVGIALLHMVGFGLLASVGLQLVPTGRSVVLAYTTPLWVAPGASLFLGERLTARRTLGVVIGLLGLLALFNPLAFDWTARAAVLGNLAVLAAALLWAASILQIRGHRWRAAPLDVLPWSLALATLVTTLVAVAVEGMPCVEWSGRLVALLLYAGVPGTAIAYWATAMAGRQRGARHAVARRAAHALAADRDRADPGGRGARRDGRALRALRPPWASGRCVRRGP